MEDHFENDNRSAPRESIESFGILLDAMHFAAEKHQNQRRKNASQTPYFNHPLEVVHLLWFTGRVRNEQVLTAAILHDTVEDTDAKLEEIERRFGSETAKIVAEVTDDQSLPNREQKRLQIVHAPTLSHGAKLIKLADKISNLGDLPESWSVERKQKYFKWAKAVIDGCRGTNQALEDLFDRVYFGFFNTASAS